MLTCKILQTVLERKLEKLIFSELPEKQNKKKMLKLTLHQCKDSWEKLFSGYTLNANKNSNNFRNVNNT